MDIINGWHVTENKYDGVLPATKRYIVFHPIYDGHYWEQHDTLEQVKNFCTVERFEEWHKNLL